MSNVVIQWDSSPNKKTVSDLTLEAGRPHIIKVNGKPITLSPITRIAGIKSYKGGTAFPVPYEGTIVLRAHMKFPGDAQVTSTPLNHPSGRRALVDSKGNYATV